MHYRVIYDLCTQIKILLPDIKSLNFFLDLNQYTKLRWPLFFWAILRGIHKIRCIKTLKTLDTISSHLCIVISDIFSRYVSIIYVDAYSTYDYCCFSAIKMSVLGSVPNVLCAKRGLMLLWKTSLLD